MKKRKSLLLLSFILFLTTIIGTALKERTLQNKNLPATIKANYLNNMDRLIRAAENYGNTLHQMPIVKAREGFRGLRLFYKELEPLAAYLDPEFVKDYINGAPLPSLERKADDVITVLDPEGFQVLEEVLFSDAPNMVEVSVLISKLEDNLKKTRKYQQQLILTDRHIFEAARFQLIRVFTLGVTGFDSPSLCQVMEEQRTSLKAVGQYLTLYLPLIEERKPHVASELRSGLDRIDHYLSKNQDFDRFDRMTFLKEHINPLFATILHAQMALGIETYYETSPLHTNHPINYFAENLFAQDFLNANYYTRHSDDKSNPNVIKLGKLLFFDPVLSENNKRSCASCHNPKYAFTDGLTKSLAFNMTGTVQRNSPTLINSVFADRFFYDLRVDVLDDQIEHVIVDHNEFRSSFLALFDKLSQSDEYIALFQQAFPELGQEPVNKYAISAALSAYVASLSGLNSPFDRYVRGESDTLDEQAIKGFNLFTGKAACGTCHFAPVFNGLVPPYYNESESEVLGVPADTLNNDIDRDPGRYAGRIKEGAPIFKNSFKTQTVRNVKYTAPYMHNGVYSSLLKVIDFYDQGGGIGLGLTVDNQTLPSDPLNLTDEEKQQLIRFMESLSDLGSGEKEIPKVLPGFASNSALNDRKVGGEY